MGGNAMIDGERSERIIFSASEKAIGAVTRQQFKNDLVILMLAMDRAVYAEHGGLTPFQTIGFDRPVFDPYSVASGSTQFLFDAGISDAAFLHYKPSMGDVDLMISDVARLDALWDIEDQPFMLVAMKEDSTQAITIWHYKRTGKNVQIDLEKTCYVYGKPISWERFIRSSSWDDQVIGIRGVFHKWLLRASTWKEARYIDLWKKGQTECVYTNMMSFSVPMGLRDKYIRNKDGSYRIPKRDEMRFVSNVESVARGLFGIPDADITSFISVANTINCTFSDEEKARVTTAFAGIMFDKGAQCLYRDDKMQDYREKLGAYNMLLKLIDISSPLDIKQKAGSYYGEFWQGEMEEVFSRQD